MTSQVIIFSKLDKGEFRFFHKKLPFFIEKSYTIVLHLANFSIDITDKNTSSYSDLCWQKLELSMSSLSMSREIYNDSIYFL